MKWLNLKSVPRGTLRRPDVRRMAELEIIGLFAAIRHMRNKNDIEGIAEVANAVLDEAKQKPDVPRKTLRTNQE
jgi:hypothetical protein